MKQRNRSTSPAHVPTAVLQDIGPLLDELTRAGATITASWHDDEHFGDYCVCLNASGTAFRIARDHGHYIVDDDVAQSKALRLFRPIDTKDQLRDAALQYLAAATRP
jgi:hypothetical protein